MSREADLYKDKIEVSLDGRQIFYLFFGGAVIVGLVFVLGVMVGRRVEARGHVDRAHTTTAADPLAALDRLEGNGLSFKGSLMGKDAPSDVEKQIGEMEKARGAHDAKPAKPDAKPEINIEAKPEVKVEAKPEVKIEAKPDSKAEVKVEAKPDPKAEVKVEAKPEKADVKPGAKPEVKPDAKPAPKVDVKSEAKAEVKPEPKKTETQKPEAKKADVVDDKPRLAENEKPKTDEKKLDDKKPDEKKEDKKPESKYTLQLSSFQDRTEADAFLSSMKASGYQPYVTEATVTGKGTFYRVRMGSYKSIEAANDAKAEFEKASKKSASVMKL